MRGIALVGVAVLTGSLLPGCTITHSKAPEEGVYSLHLQTLRRSEFSILDTVEGQGEVGKFLCLFRTGDRKFGHVGGSTVGGLFPLPPGRNAVAAATYDALEKVPDADYILPLTTTVTRSGLPFCFWTEKATVRGKAIKIKSDSESQGG